jgi:hypothetical protein
MFTAGEKAFRPLVPLFWIFMVGLPLFLLIKGIRDSHFMLSQNS